MTTGYADIGTTVGPFDEFPMQYKSYHLLLVLLRLLTSKFAWYKMGFILFVRVEQK